MYIALYSVRNKVKDWLFSRQVALTNKSPLASLTILRYKYSRAGRLNVYSYELFVPRGDAHVIILRDALIYINRTL